MDSSAVLRSFHHPVGTVSHVRSLLERPGIASNSRKLYVQCLSIGGKLSSHPIKRKGMSISCLKTPETFKTDAVPQGSSVKNSPQNATFPNGFEALILEVCDETEVAELKVKIGDFEMHMKRNIEATKPTMSFVSPTVAPPIPSKPTIESIPENTPPSEPSSEPSRSLPKSSSGSTNPFKNAAIEKPRKLLALEASGATGYVFVNSPAVGSFRRGRTGKGGRRFPPVCREGDLIKEGQLIGYLFQFGTQVPVRSDKAGEILKILFDENDPVGFGDPMLAILPSFHRIK